MKVMILAGGVGTRISEESTLRPKPMVEIGSMPILWHIMKIYSSFGLNDFVICCGYMGHYIKEWFSNYRLRGADVSFDFRSGTTTFHNDELEPWKVTLVDTGAETMTGGRIKRAMEFVGDETFCLTYGDGVADVNVTELIDFHKSAGCRVTMTAVQPAGRFGLFTLESGQSEVDDFDEKPRGDGAWANGGFFVVDPSVRDHIDGDDTVWEVGPLKKFSAEGELAAYRHEGFWMPMDTLRDKLVLNEIWDEGTPPWKLW